MIAKDVRNEELDLKPNISASSNHNDLLGRPQMPWALIDWVILIIGALIFLILYIPFWINPEFKQGVDEGILVMQGKMVAEGYSLYSEVYSNQAPLGIMIFALLQGDFIATRLVSLIAALIGLIGVGLLARELTGRRGMVISLLFFGGDKVFLRQSHMASITLFSVVFTIWAGYFFLIYVRNIQRDRYLALSGFFLGLATLCKLFAGILALIAFLGLIALLRSQQPGWMMSRMTLFCIAGLLPLFLVVLFVDPTLMIQRTILDQLNQPRTWTDIIPNFDAIKEYLDQDFSLLVFFSLVGMGATYKSRAGIFVLVWFWGLLAFFAVYWLLWPQHLLYLSVPLVLEITLGLLFLWDHARSLSTINPHNHELARALQIGILLAVAFSSFVIFDNYATAVVAPRKPVVEVAERVKDLTTSDEMILSGDPRVTVLADRLSPPWLTDVAENRPDALNSSYLVEILDEYSIRVVILAYWLLEQEDFCEFVAEQFSFDSAYSEYDGSIKWIYEVWIKPY